MKIKVLFWGVLTDVAQTKQVEIQDVSQLKALKQQLFEQYPKLAVYSHHIAINHEIVHEENWTLEDGDEVALLPPYAGG